MDHNIFATGCNDCRVRTRIHITYKGKRVFTFTPRNALVRAFSRVFGGAA